MFLLSIVALSDLASQLAALFNIGVGASGSSSVPGFNLFCSPSSPLSSVLDEVNTKVLAAPYHEKKINKFLSIRFSEKA